MAYDAFYFSTCVSCQCPFSFKMDVGNRNCKDLASLTELSLNILTLESQKCVIICKKVQSGFSWGK